MAKKPKLTKKERKVLREFKQRLIEKFKNDLLELKLFGSKARGDFHKESDVDVLIVLKKKNKKNEDFIIELTAEIGLSYGINISPIIFSEKEYNYQRKFPSIFIQILEREAIPL